MKVLKFGGSSVGSVEGLLNVKKIVESQDETCVVVVSAFGGITDKLLKVATLASQSDSAYETILDEIKERHFSIIEQVVKSENVEGVKAEVAAHLEELSNILKGIFLIKDLSSKTNNTIVSYGERLSSFVVSHVIDNTKLFDAREFIKTVPNFNKHIVDFDVTNALIKEKFTGLAHNVVLGGFISSDKVSGDITNLGRGGSDYTAAIIAAEMDASILEIWTDVDGFMTADPRVINNAYVIEKLTYVEAMELCNFGAKVVYPPTIYPVFHKNVPIVIKNTYNIESKGTLITKGEEGEEKSKLTIKGISSINDTAIITIQGLGMVGVIGVNSRIFNCLANAGISVFFVSQAASENTTSIGVKNVDTELAVEVLNAEFEVEMNLGEINPIKVKKNLATVAIVGGGMKYTTGVAGKLFGTIGRNGINVIACAQGASETNISFVVKHESLRKTLNVIHDSFFLSDYKVLNIFLTGVGLVGSNLVDQIHKQQSKLLANNSLQIRVVGIANSKRYILDRDGIDLSNYKELLANSENVSTPEIYKDQIVEMNIFNSVFVDCTASSDVAKIYKDLLLNNVSIVTANKIAASSSFENYQDLKMTARKKDVKFLYETNVGAGLPIINTINDLINSGDKILKIEAVVSGTLNFIFNEMNEEIPMSKAIKMAQEAGYAEPDPRIDLSGVDVIRKLVILSREAGYTIEQDDVKKNLFIPNAYFDGSLDEFWAKISNVDAEFEEKRKALVEKGGRWRFVAKLDEGDVSVGLQEVDDKHPFYYLEGSNNIVLISTDRYNEYPMQIKGYGAGASVTAAGVFADIISIANIR
ncbi:MAG: bifunctional aspartate kinase/homoserine dehydrogenase I [Rikenellaceae bacterium]